MSPSRLRVKKAGRTVGAELWINVPRALGCPHAER